MATDSAWDRLRKRLVTLGWREEIAEGREGLCSPADAMFIDASNLEPESRQMLVTTLTRKIETIERHKSEGFYPPGIETAHRDFKQILECLAELHEN